MAQCPLQYWWYIGVQIVLEKSRCPNLMYFPISWCQTNEGCGPHRYMSPLLWYMFKKLDRSGSRARSQYCYIGVRIVLEKSRCLNVIYFSISWRQIKAGVCLNFFDTCLRNWVTVLLCRSVKKVLKMLVPKLAKFPHFVTAHWFGKFLEHVSRKQRHTPMRPTSCISLASRNG